MSTSPPILSRFPERIRFPGRKPAHAPTLLAVHDSLHRQVVNAASLEFRLLRQLRSFPLRHSFFETAHVRLGDGAVRLDFRDGSSVACGSPAQLALLLYAVYAAETLLGPKEVVPTVRRLEGISSYVLGRLESEYSAAEVESGDLGGIPSPKEVVLYCLVRRLKPDVVIETGVAQGVSSVFILEALEDNQNGGLTSIDLPNYRPEGRNYVAEPGTHDGTYVKRQLEVGWLVPARLRTRWKLLLGASRDVLPALTTARVNLFYHDSEHSYPNMMFEYGWALRHLSPGGVLASDDISWNSAFPDFVAKHSRELRVLSSRRFGVAWNRSLPPAV